MVVGVMIAFLVVALQNPWYARKLEENNNTPVPEWRLPIAMVGDILLSGMFTFHVIKPRPPIHQRTAGLFWFGWTGYTGRVLWVASLLSRLFTGFGIFGVFLSPLNYIVDTYLMFAASAMAGNTFMRSLFGGILPLFATYMFNGMSIEWASTVSHCAHAMSLG